MPGTCDADEKSPISLRRNLRYPVVGTPAAGYLFGRVVIESKLRNMAVVFELLLVFLVAGCLLALSSGSGRLTSPVIVPLVLVMGSLLANFVHRGRLADLGLCWGSWAEGLRLLALVCIGSFFLLFVCLWGCRLLDMRWPLSAKPPTDRRLWWMLFQFTHVAFPEELFFRGYVQARIGCLGRTICSKNSLFPQVFAIIVAAFVFALIHALMWKNAACMLTFFPGLVLGWLFLQTGSLLTPVLFHGIANIGYGMMVVNILGWH